MTTIGYFWHSLAVSLVSGSCNGKRVLDAVEQKPATLLSITSTPSFKPNWSMTTRPLSAAAKTVSGLVASLGGLDVLALNAGIAQSTGDTDDGFDNCTQV